MDKISMDPFAPIDWHVGNCQAPTRCSQRQNSTLQTSLPDGKFYNAQCKISQSQLRYGFLLDWYNPDMDEMPAIPAKGGPPPALPPPLLMVADSIPSHSE